MIAQFHYQFCWGFGDSHVVLGSALFLEDVDVNKFTSNNSCEFVYLPDLVSFFVLCT